MQQRLDETQGELMVTYVRACLDSWRANKAGEKASHCIDLDLMTIKPIHANSPPASMP